MNFGPVNLTTSDLILLNKSIENCKHVPPEVPKVMQAIQEYVQSPKMAPQTLHEITQDLNNLITTLCPEHRQLQAAQDLNKQILACHLMLIGAIFALNAAKAYIMMSMILKTNDDTTHKQINDLHDLCYAMNETCEFLYKDVIEKSPELKALHQRYFDVWFSHGNSIVFNKITLDHLTQLIARKNAAQEEQGGNYHGELIHNPQTTYLVAFDDFVFEKFIQKCQKILRGEQARTQFVVYVHGRAGHVMAFDVSCNREKNQLQLISLESAQDAKQYHYLDKIIKRLENLRIDFEILACQMDVQKDPSNCSLFAFVIGGIVAKKSFEELRVSIDQPHFYSHFTKQTSHPKLTSTTWFKTTALGEKAVLLCQSSQAMKDNLKAMGKTPKDITDTIENWTLWYGLDFSHQKSYINHRMAMGHLKLNNSPFANITLDEILTKLKAKNLFIALRRLSAGFATKRLLEWLLLALKKGSLNIDEANADGNSAAHISIQYKQPKRALLLFKYGASFDKPNVEGKTARQLYLTSTEPALLANPKLREKLKT